MRLDELHLWYPGDPTSPLYVGALKLVSAGKGVSLRYDRDWLANGFALSEDLPLIDNEFLPPGRLAGDIQRAVGAVDDARPDRAGITVAETRPVPLAGVNAIAIRRFDRYLGRRIHSISAGTAIRAAAPSGSEAELGYPELALILRRVGLTRDDINKRDAIELFRRMVFNILIDNTDDHEKNHALLVTEPFANARLRLVPAYDVLPTNSGQGFQEFICGAQGRESTLGTVGANTSPQSA